MCVCVCVCAHIYIWIHHMQESFPLPLALPLHAGGRRDVLVKKKQRLTLLFPRHHHPTRVWGLHGARCGAQFCTVAATGGVLVPRHRSAGTPDQRGFLFYFLPSNRTRRGEERLFSSSSFSCVFFVGGGDRGCCSSLSLPHSRAMAFTDRSTGARELSRFIHDPRARVSFLYVTFNASFKTPELTGCTQPVCSSHPPSRHTREEPERTVSFSVFIYRTRNCIRSAGHSWCVYISLKGPLWQHQHYAHAHALTVRAMMGNLQLQLGAAWWSGPHLSAGGSLALFLRHCMLVSRTWEREEAGEALRKISKNKSGFVHTEHIYVYILMCISLASYSSVKLGCCPISPVLTRG